MFTKAIVRIPGSNFAEGLTTVDLGSPHFETVLKQHAAYCDALRHCGLSLTTLKADLRFPDSTFVEDTAILTPRGAVLTRPGAPSRAGEVDAIRELFPGAPEIHKPGTLDGGDICEADDRYFLGLSHRTNEEGIRQLAAHLESLGYKSSVIDIRGMKSILHLKSGISYVGGNTMIVMEEMANHKLFQSYRLVHVPVEESYSANCVRINDYVLVAAGYPRIVAQLKQFGFTPLTLDMSEFQKMDGGLSCLSLRF